MHALGGANWGCGCACVHAHCSVSCWSTRRAGQLDPAQVVREGSRRVLGLRPFDVQLIGGMILHDGQIAEMRCGTGVLPPPHLRDAAAVHPAAQQAGS